MIKESANHLAIMLENIMVLPKINLDMIHIKNMSKSLNIIKEMLLAKL